MNKLQGFGMRLAGAAVLAVGGLFYGAAHSGEAPKTIVETAVEAGSFETLVAAVEAAGLAETLSGDGPFTVFAPTDEAFAALPEGTVEALLDDIPTLTAILTYHVAPGALSAGDVAGSESIETVFGQAITVDTGDGVRVDGAAVTTADIACSNGVIHVIDAVILPKDLAETAASAGGFGTLLAAAEAAGLMETLKESGPFTVFAPTDEAFAALPEGVVASLLEPENQETLARVLTYHVASGRVKAAEAVELDAIPTIEGGALPVEVDREDGEITAVRVGGATVIATDVPALNGVIHVIDSVLLPPDMQ